MLESQRAIRILFQPRKHRRVDQTAIDRVVDQELGFAVIHRHRPEGVYRRQSVLGEGRCVVVFAVVQYLSVGENPRQWIHRLNRAVAEDPALGSSSTR